MLRSEQFVAAVVVLVLALVLGASPLVLLLGLLVGFAVVLGINMLGINVWFAEMTAVLVERFKDGRLCHLLASRRH